MLQNPFRRNAIRSPIELWATIGLGVVLIFFLGSGFAAYLNIRSLQANNQEIVQTHTVLMSLNELLLAAQDAETGQRGYLLTGDTRYLQPYTVARSGLEAQLETVADLTQDSPAQRNNVAALRRHVETKTVELDETIALQRTAGPAAALERVRSDQGRIAMDAIRTWLGAIEQEEVRLRQERIVAMEAAFRAAVITGALSALFGAGLTVAVFLLIRRSARARAREDWLRLGQVGLSTAMMGDLTIQQLSDNVLGFLSRYVGSQAGALFKGEGGLFRRVATLGVPSDAPIPMSFKAREGLLGQAATDGQTIVLNDVPQGYLTIGSALGRDTPRHLVIVPMHADDVVNAVIELGFLKAADDRVMDLLQQAAPSIGVALRSARYRSDLQNLLEETQRQAEELQVQSEELRVSNEELEEQGRALRESQVRLEQQQVELEQTNSQLEEQAQALESQRDDLERASAGLSLKARELEQASQYKSDFLANMSHELRTPLNSLLILSKLLGDNPAGNLTEEQVKHARTIHGSGEDLLTLINDILDLSKIEAGHVQIRPEDLPLQRLIRDLEDVFRPVATSREVAFEIQLADGAPEALVTDRQRLEQVLKNLLSNAFKFTESGGVRLKIGPAGPHTLAFAVADTGIGIAADQQQSIFEAFQQADGTISRRYGGTGLGLSISRELARLLGGSITLKSEPGEGSCFTLLIPVAYDAAEVAPRDIRTAPTAGAPTAASADVRLDPGARSARIIADDRNDLAEARRLLLVVEDDDRFAAIVRDLSREMGFQCLVAPNAEEALKLSRQFRPSAIVLDIGLPDQSGLTVLDTLKRDDATRHIPIHVVSAEDHSQTALSLGAVGYLMKPVKREALAEVLTTLEAKLTRTVRRVLIVEDDAAQREAIEALLKTGDVETVAVGTAAECLERLEEETFDCMVLDLSLPDASGLALLETLSQGGDHAYPPVIVYTGRELSPDSEQQLRRYSSSIIIKGAKSPERLLDEVSLFLHSVVSELPMEQQRMIRQARSRDALLEGRRILVVEDDIRNIYALSNVLEPRGAVVDIARNGQEALETLAKGEGTADAVDLVLMDVMMPVMDGLAATQAIRNDLRHAHLPIIMLTAKAMPDDQERCLAAGANDYMAKPIDVDKLLSLVRVWMPR